MFIFIKSRFADLRKQSRALFRALLEEALEAEERLL